MFLREAVTHQTAPFVNKKFAVDYTDFLCHVPQPPPPPPPFLIPLHSSHLLSSAIYTLAVTL